MRANIVMNALPVGLFETDVAGRLIDGDESFRSLALSGGTLPTGAAPWANAHPVDRAATEVLWRRASATGSPFSSNFRVWTLEGRVRWLRADTTPKLDLFGQHVGYSGCITDITEHIRQRQLSERLTGLLEASLDAVLVIDRHGSPTFTNEAARKLFGVTDAVDFVREPEIRALLQKLRNQIPREVVNNPVSADWNGEVVHRGPDGSTRVLNVTVYVQRADDGAIDFWAGQIRDVTATKQLQAELAHQATHDSLTALPNRTFLLRTLAEALERVAYNGEQIGLFFLDVDRLKDVNDNAGHEIGDRLLASLAGRLALATRPADVVARIGGDEFVVLCEGGIDEHTALDLAERMRQVLSGPLMLNGVEVNLSVSIGVSLSSLGHSLDSSTADEAVALLHNADSAMYCAKQLGRSRCVLFSQEMSRTAHERKDLSASLEQALARDEFQLLYQPIVSAHTGRTIGAEALLRWYHPERGLLMPIEFVPLAEESGIIVPIGDWAIGQACRDARTWIDTGLVHGTFSMHVNVSGRQMLESSFVERVMATVRMLDLAPHQLTLDFDETTLNGEHPMTTRGLQTLRRFGVNIAVNSFGTGVSSLTALRGSLASVLKLDGTIASTLGNVTSDDYNDPIVQSIIQLAHALDMEVVAEWVTSADQLYRLKMLGCDMAQGFLFGAPCSADAFATTAGAHGS
jgi:diguanylate cyclase (GGDEF)-like protein/PAS domain S-box-containing protein